MARASAALSNTANMSSMLHAELGTRLSSLRIPPVPTPSWWNTHQGPHSDLQVMTSGGKHVSRVFG